jgi:hypothetical protein
VTLTAPVPRRRRGRWTGWIVALVIVAVLVVVALVVGERIARETATKQIHDGLATAFALPADAPMDIDLGPGLLLAQLAGGSIDEATITIDDVPLDELSGTVTIRATGFPLAADAPVQTLRATATVDEKDVQKLRSYISGIDLDSIALGDGVVEVGAAVKVLAFSLPVTADVEPSVDAGSLVFTPVTVSVNGVSLPLDALLDGPFASIAESIVPAQSFCVAEYLPAEIGLSAVRVTPEALELDFVGDGALVGAADFADPGSCP